MDGERLKRAVVAAIAHGVVYPIGHVIGRVWIHGKKIEFYFKHPDASRKEAAERLERVVTLTIAKFEGQDTIAIHRNNVFVSWLRSIKICIELSDDRNPADLRYIDYMLSHCHKSWLEDIKITPVELMCLIRLEDKYKKHWGRDRWRSEVLL